MAARADGSTEPEAYRPESCGLETGAPGDGGADHRRPGFGQSSNHRGTGYLNASLTQLHTVEELNSRFRLAAAPVSPAPAGRVPAGPVPTGGVPAGPVPASNAPAGPVPADRAGVHRDHHPAPASRPRPTSTDVPGRETRNRAGCGWERRYLRSLLATDLLVGLGAGVAAFGLRFGNDLTPYNRGYAILSALLPLALIVALAVNRAYERRHLYVGTDEYQRVLRAGLAVTATLAVVAYAFELRPARGYVSIALPLATLACVLARFASRKRLHRARERGDCLRRVIVVGHELAVVALTRQLRRERYHGLEVVGACLPPLGPGPSSSGAGAPWRGRGLGAPWHSPGTGAPTTWHDGRVGMPVYGTFDDVAAAVSNALADTVIVLSCPELDGHALRRLAWQLERDDVDLIVASSLMDVAGDRTTIRPVDGLPMLHVEHPTLTGARRVVKSAFDRIGAGLLLLVFAPLMASLVLAVRLDSSGPVLFRQVRVGKDGRGFVMYKFRTMYADAEARLGEIRHLNEHDGVLFKIRDDPRVTRVGRLLRRLSLDELPQLFNVLGGSMSLVGPRPPLPHEAAAYPEDVCRRLAVRPGMTGLWQVSGRSDLPWEEAVRLDLRYVENWSLSFDLVIMLRTLTAVIRSSGAY